MKVSKLSYVVAILLALVAGLAVYFYQTGADNRALAGKQAVTVVVAKKDIAAGIRLSDAVAQGLVGYDSFPAGAVPADALATVDANNSALVVSHAIGAGQLVLNSELSTYVNANSQIQIPTGTVAITVNMDDASRVASFTAPGSKVVVYWTPADATSARVLLPVADVIAVGATSTASAPTQNGQPAGNTALVTLALNPVDAPRVVLAAKTGSLYFGLLADGTTLVEGSGVTSSGLIGGSTK